MSHSTQKHLSVCPYTIPLWSLPLKRPSMCWNLLSLYINRNFKMDLCGHQYLYNFFLSDSFWHYHPYIIILFSSCFQLLVLLDQILINHNSLYIKLHFIKEGQADEICSDDSAKRNGTPLMTLWLLVPLGSQTWS